MSESGLYAVEAATIQWQNTTQSAQQYCAETVDLEANVLMLIYQQAQSELDKLMQNKSANNPNGKPTDVNDSKKYPTEVQVWQAYYNEVSQKYQNFENQWNTPIQSGDQELQTLGNAAQEASSMATTVGKPNSVIASLLQAQL